jgi:acyl-CoA thioesterase I
VALAVVTLVIASSTGPGIGRIVALGDSITHGYPDAATGWTDGLGLVDEGIPGERTDQMLARLPTILTTRPRLVLVMGGTNDLTQGVAQSTIIANLRAITDVARTSRVPVGLLTIAPRSDPSWVGPTDALNQQIQSLARTAGIPLIDVHSVLAGPDGTYAPGLSIDGLHPSPAGYAKIAAIVQRAIFPDPSEPR